MNKKHIEEFYKRIQKEKPYQIFALSLPMLLTTKHLYNQSESFYKTKYDLIHSEIDVLAALYFNNEEHRMTPTELYDAMIFSSGGMTKILKKLQDRKLIIRQRSKKDKRSQDVLITEEGKEIILECVDSTSKRLSDFFNVLNQKEKASLQSILQKLIFSTI